jgi:3-methyl-2-oxobutanoate hydroxymethyltransferase
MEMAMRMEDAGAAALLLEAVPAEVTSAVVEATSVPIIGCGAGNECHGFVIVTPDALGLTPRRPKFAPLLQDLASPLKAAFGEFVKQVSNGQYPASEHLYEMPMEEKERFLETLKGF